MGYITKDHLSPELQEELDYLKKLHDPDYAKQFAVEKLLNDYKSMVDTDIWYEAAKEYLKSRVSLIEFNVLINNFKFKHNLYDPIISGDGNYDLITIQSGGDYNTVVWVDEDGGVLKNFHYQLNPEIEGYEFEKFCIKYKENNS